jgi:hypothetical protein
MKTRFKSMVRPLEVEFEFAGFSFPKYVWTLPRGSMAKRLASAKNPSTGGYYHAPTPNKNIGQGFYLDSDGMMGLRWQWCDDVCKAIDHTGWYSDEHSDSEKIRGLVMRLPRSRGFLPGWSMGEGMASEVDSTIYDTEEDAARAADSMAERAAERQRDFEAEERAKMEADEARLTTSLYDENA